MVILSIDINDGRLDNMLEKNYDEMPFLIIRKDTGDKTIYEL